jgi:hypothetical protein
LIAKLLVSDLNPKSSASTQPIIRIHLKFSFGQYLE